ncbi:MAG TPA: hypothetical protein VF961_01780, partial [Pyrinomonadaceae bacterium]
MNVDATRGGHYNRRQKRFPKPMLSVYKSCCCTLVMLFLFTCALTASAQQRPLLTEDVDIIPP